MERSDPQRQGAGSRSVSSGSAPIDATSWVQATLSRVIPRLDVLAPAVLHRLLERYPTLRVFFPDPDGESSRLLAVWVQRIAALLDDPVQLAPELVALGRIGARRGVRPLHLEAFSESLQFTVAAFEGDRWTPATEGAWRCVTIQVAAIIQNGLRFD